MTNTAAIASTSGSLLAGCCVQLVLFGIGSMQTYLYFWNYSADTIRLKLVVASLWALGACDVGLGFGILWHIFILDDVDPSNKLQTSLRICLVQGLIESLIACCVQLYLIQRVWHFATGKWRIFPTVLLILSGWPPIGLICFVALTYDRPVFTFYTPHLFGIVLSITTVTAFIDTCLAVNMILLLRPYRTRYSRTQGVVYRLQLLVINTSFFTALISILTLVLYVAKPNTLDLLTPFIPIGLVYFCCLLTNLNARQFVRGQGGTIIISNLESVGHSDIVFAPRQDSEVEPTPARALVITALELSTPAAFPNPGTKG